MDQNWELIFMMCICVSPCVSGQQAGERYCPSQEGGLGWCVLSWGTTEHHSKPICSRVILGWLCWKQKSNADKTVTAFGLVMWKWEDLAEGLEGCWELLSERINVFLEKSVLVVAEMSEALWHASPFIGNKEAVWFQTASPLNYSMQLNNYRALLSYVKPQNWLPPLLWLNAIFLNATL